METTRSLPPSVERKHIHSRHVESHGFLRADGLWDIEARIKDTKTYFTRNADGRERQPGEALHHMEVRLTLDDTLKVFNAPMLPIRCVASLALLWARAGARLLMRRWVACEVARMCAS